MLMDISETKHTSSIIAIDKRPTLIGEITGVIVIPLKPTRA
jgi:hypothetical protein